MFNFYHYVILLLLAAITSVNVIFAQGNNNEAEKYLVVNPSGHKASIRDVAITNDGKYIVTGSFDKTVKKWDIETGEVVQQFHGEIGTGIDGSVYFIALSPDNKYLAVQGWFGSEDETEPLGDVRVYNFETGDLYHVFHDLESSPKGLGFSNDSKYLIAGDQNSVILKWDLAAKKVVGEFKYHSSEYGKALDVLCIKDDIMVTIDELGITALWDINSPGKPIKVDKNNLAKLVKENYYDTPAIDIAPGTHDICITWEEFVFFMTPKLKLQGYFQNKSRPNFVKFSPDGRKLITGVSDVGNEMASYLFYINENDTWAELAQIPQTASRQAGAFIDNDRFVMTGGNYHEITLYKMDMEKLELEDYMEIKNNAIDLYSANLNNGKLAYSDRWTENFGNSEYNKVFDLFLKRFSDVSDPKNYKYPEVQYEDFLIDRARVGNVSKDFNKGLAIKKNGTAIDTIIREEWYGARHVSFTFDNNSHIISGGDAGVLQAFDTSGNVINYFEGHVGIISGVSISDDGKRLISSSSDGTIKIWPLDKVGIANTPEPPYSMWDFVIDYFGEKDGKTFHRLFTQYGIDKSAKTKTWDAWEETIVVLEKNGATKGFFRTHMNDLKAGVIHPIVSVFITTDGEWIIWNEDGYFTASKGGAKYVGYHVNQGIDKAAKFYPFEQFDLKYNRPDIILEDLSLGNEKIRDFYYKAYLKRLKKMGVDQSELTDDIHVPELQIKAHTLSEDKKKAAVDIEFSDSKYKLDRLNIYVNDVPIYGSAGLKVKSNETQRSLEIDLAEGKNKVQISVLNKKGVESYKENLYFYSPKGDTKPDLYLITIGTSNYKDDRFDLKYASKDAHDINALYAQQKVYQNIHYKTLTDEEATKSNILALKEFLQNANINDVVLVFIAGHGLLDENLDYYYATYDIDFNNPTEKGLLYAELESILDGLKALKKLLFMDTCHSGEVDKDEMEASMEEKVVEEDVTFRNAGVGICEIQGVGSENMSELVKELFTDLRRGTGATVISSAGGAEYAMEGDQWQNGLFTYCLLIGLKNKTADINQDGEIMLSELQQYLQSEVLKMSNGKQKPTSRIENISLDYPVWK
jgi:WD40 repeat protein/uncharacterized caspase-like protein